ncbi:MAG: hypothetical protein V4622_11490 [Bacteroidota bacterium]
MKIKAILSVIFIAILKMSYSQTGVFYYSDSVSDRPNVHIIDMKEATDKSIYLLGESKNTGFDSSAVWFGRIDAKGKMLNQVSRGTDVESLKKIFLSSEEKALYIGNKPSYTGKPQSFSNYYTKEGKPKDLSVMALSYPIILGDAVSSNNTIYAAQANQDKETKLFNLAIVKAPVDKYMPFNMCTIKSDFHEVPAAIAVNSKNEIIVACLRIGEQENSVPVIYKLDAEGKELWKFKPDVDFSFLNMALTLDSKEDILISFGYRDNVNYTSLSVIKKLNTKGEEIQTEFITDIKSNGMEKLKNGKILLYGGNFKAYDNRMIISRGCFTILNEDLSVSVADELNESDNPEKSFPKDVVLDNPICSEFMTGIQLVDGRILLGGRILLPDYTDVESIKESKRTNKAVVLFTNAEGKFR